MHVRRFASALLVALCLVLSGVEADAQENAAAFDPSTLPRVTAAKGSWHNGSAGLGDRLVVTVRNFPALLAKVNGNCHAIVLYLDTLPLREMPPESCSEFDGTVRYLLDRIPDGNDTEWHRLLGSPDGFARRTRVSIGPDDQFPYPTDVVAFPLKVIPRARFYVFVVLFAALSIAFIHLCRTTSIIRSPAHPSPAGERPYSLSRFQMAFWFFFVISGYVFMWLITGELDTITDSVLALMGIGAGTALGAALIDTTPSGTTTRTTIAGTPTSESVTSVVTAVPPPAPATDARFPSATSSPIPATGLASIASRCSPGR